MECAAGGRESNFPIDFGNLIVTVVGQGNLLAVYRRPSHGTKWPWAGTRRRGRSWRARARAASVWVRWTHPQLVELSRPAHPRAT